MKMTKQRKTSNLNSKRNSARKGFLCTIWRMDNTMMSSQV